MRGAARRSKPLDLLVSLCTLWISCGFFLDAWAHGHVPVETFFTPYHGVFYSGMLALAIVLIAFRRRIPRTYRFAMLGVPVFLLSGLGDLLWHRAFGVEEGVDALLSPTHQGLGLGIFLLASGPISSALQARAHLRSLGDYLPLIFSLATWIELVHFGTAYAFDPGAWRIDAPPSTHAFTPDYLTALAIGYYKIGTGVLIVLFQSALIAGFALFAGSRFPLPFGSMTLVYLLGNTAAAAAFTNDTPLLGATIVMSIAAGLSADAIIVRTRPRAEAPAAYRLLGIAVPMVYFIAYFAAMGVSGGVWWDWNVVLGATLWAGVIGFGLTLLAPPRTQRMGNL